jgi:invasion protein IalB
MIRGSTHLEPTMKRSLIFASFLAILLQGCASTPGGKHASTASKTPAVQQASAATPSTPAAQPAAPDTGGWLIVCQKEAGRLLSQCRAEMRGHILHSLGDERYQPAPVLWVSWMKGEDPDKRTVCVLGHDYPVNAVQFQVDDNPPLALTAATASGCFLSNQTFIDQLRKGQQLVVSFLRFPWGETKLRFDLHGSNNALDELRERVTAYR